MQDGLYNVISAREVDIHICDALTEAGQGHPQEIERMELWYGALVSVSIPVSPGHFPKLTLNFLHRWYLYNLLTELLAPLMDLRPSPQCNVSRLTDCAKLCAITKTTNLVSTNLSLWPGKCVSLV